MDFYFGLLIGLMLGVSMGAVVMCYWPFKGNK